MILKLVTVKEYCKKEGITDGAARKSIAAKRVKSVQLDNMTYIVIRSDEVARAKRTIKSLRGTIKVLKAQALLYTRQDELIAKLEAKVSKLEERLDETTDKKEALYEKVIAQYHGLFLENKRK